MTRLKLRLKTNVNFPNGSTKMRSIPTVSKCYLLLLELGNVLDEVYLICGNVVLRRMEHT